VAAGLQTVNPGLAAQKPLRPAHGLRPEAAANRVAARAAL
jgi:hypothetical protein